MTRNYSAIVFDLGNVLIPFSYETAITKLDKIYPGLGKRFWDYYRENYSIHRDFEKGIITEDDFIARMLAVLENRISRSLFCEYYSKIFSENKEVSELLPALKERYILVLLSNTNSIHMEYGWKDYPFLRYFDKLILSHRVHALKPEPEIYHSVVSFTRRPPTEHLFIDDIAEYVQAAKSMGWDGIVFENAAHLKGELETRGIL